jgi:hypothetical protein
MGHGAGMAHAGGVGHFGAANVGGGAWRGGAWRGSAFRSAAFPGRHGFFPGRHAFFRHHFRHRHFFVGGVGVGYAYDDSCYQPVLTQWGWRYQWVCGYDY